MPMEDYKFVLHQNQESLPHVLRSECQALGKRTTLSFVLGLYDSISHYKFVIETINTFCNFRFYWNMTSRSSNFNYQLSTSEGCNLLFFRHAVNNVYLLSCDCRVSLCERQASKYTYIASVNHQRESETDSLSLLFIVVKYIFIVLIKFRKPRPTVLSLRYRLGILPTSGWREFST